MKNKIKIAIAGYGVVGKLRHKSINKLKDFELIAVCDKNLKKMETLVMVLNILGFIRNYSS